MLIKSSDPADLLDAAQLRISAQFMINRRAQEQVALNMGNTTLRYAPDQAERTQEELATAFLLGEVHSDVLVMDDHSFDLASLGRKGYLLDLSSSQALRDHVENLDPKLQPMLWQDGKLVMVPYHAQLITPMAHAAALEELGLSVPRDFFALCDLVEGFAQEGLLWQAPQGLLHTNNLQETLVRFGVELYFQAAHAQGGDVRFDDPLFHSMMERVQQLGNIQADISASSAGDVYPLMSLWNGLDTTWMIQEGDYVRAFDFFVMAAQQETNPAVQAHFTMLAINSRSPAPEQAIQFLEEAIATVDPRIQVLLTPDAQGPLLNPDYLHDLAEDRNRLAMFEDIAATAEDERTRESYQAEAQAIRLRLQDAETTLRFLESQQTVAAVRDIAQFLVPQTGLMHRQRFALNATDLIGQLANGVITLEQFIQQADSKLRLVELENQ